MHGADGITLFPEACDAQAFLTHLGEVSSRHSIEIHCYCLMSTHYHLLLHRTLIKDEEHLRSCVRYIVRNPVDAGLCLEPGGWAWSSHRATIGSGPRPWYLHTDLALGPTGTVGAYLRDVGAC